MSTSLAEASSHAITPEDFLRYDSEIREAKRERDDAAANFARAQKAAKNGAVDLKAYKFVAALRRLDDDEQIVVARHLVQYIQWLDMPIGTQLSMMDAPKIPKPTAKARAEHNLFDIGEAGLRAGRQGEPAKNNLYLNGSEEHAIWARNHAAGLAERATAARMQEDDEDNGPVADSTTIPGPKKRGRSGFIPGTRVRRKQLNGAATH